MAEIALESPCNPCSKRPGIPAAYNHPYHSRGYQPYPAPPKPPRIPSDLRKSIEEEKRASMTEEELKELELMKKKKKKQPKKINVQAILNNLACPEPKEKVKPPKPRKPPPGVSEVYWKLQQQRYLKPPPVGSRRKEKFSIHENQTASKPPPFPLYESPSYLESKPKFHFTPEKKRLTPSPAMKSIIVKRYGRELMSELDSLKTKFRAFDIKPPDFKNVPVNRLDWACEKFRQCASANLPAWYNLLRSYVLGPPETYFFYMNRPEALDCWERMQDGNYHVRDCCVNKVKYENVIPVIPSLKTPPKKVYDPCEGFRKEEEEPQDDEEYETDDEEFMEDLKEFAELLVLHETDEEVVNRKSKYDEDMMPILKHLGKKESVGEGATEYEGEEEGEYASEEMEGDAEEGGEEEEEVNELEEMERFIKSNSIVDKAFQLDTTQAETQLDVVGSAKSVEEKQLEGPSAGCSKSNKSEVLYKPPGFPPFCDPVPPLEKRLPWHIPPLRPRDGDEPLFSYPDRDIDLGDIISKITDPYGEERRKQKAELKRQIKWAMLKGFFERNGMPAVETMSRLMKLDIPEDHPLTKFKLNKALHKLLYLKDEKKRDSVGNTLIDEVDTKKMERVAERMKKPDYSHVKSKYLEPSARYRKVMWL